MTLVEDINFFGYTENSSPIGIQKNDSFFAANDQLYQGRII
jgi:hypothetical protein